MINIIFKSELGLTAIAEILQETEELLKIEGSLHSIEATEKSDVL
jgi:hypothetical protein